MSITLGPGSRLPAYCASMGRVLLASLPEAEALGRITASDRKANTEYTRTDPDELMAELARVRAQGFAVIDQELELGLRSIAVPLEDARGRVVAALNIGVPAVTVPVEEMTSRFPPAMREVQVALRSLLQ